MHQQQNEKQMKACRFTQGKTFKQKIRRECTVKESLQDIKKHYRLKNSIFRFKEMCVEENNLENLQNVIVFRNSEHLSHAQLCSSFIH